MIHWFPDSESRHVHLPLRVAVLPGQWVGLLCDRIDAPDRCDPPGHHAVWSSSNAKDEPRNRVVLCK